MILQPHNILLAYGAGGVTCKLSDFGTCIRVPSNQMLTEEIGTSGYTAPEIFDPKSYNLSADVFSMGILLWDIFFAEGQENPLVGLDPDDVVSLVCTSAE